MDGLAGATAGAAMGGAATLPTWRAAGNAAYWMLVGAAVMLLVLEWTGCLHVPQPAATAAPEPARDYD